MNISGGMLMCLNKTTAILALVICLGLATNF